MRIHGTLKIGERKHAAGWDVPWFKIYPFFLIHMLGFGLSGFMMCYAAKGVPMRFVLLHSGVAIFVYLIFYLSVFGRDEVKWMLINGALGLFGIWSQVDWILSKFGKEISSYPRWSHITPFLYYILYTFLLRQAFIDLFRAREIESRRKIVEASYVCSSLMFYLWIYLISD